MMYVVCQNLTYFLGSNNNNYSTDILMMSYLILVMRVVHMLLYNNYFSYLFIYLVRLLTLSLPLRGL